MHPVGKRAEKQRSYHMPDAEAADYPPDARRAEPEAVPEQGHGKIQERSQAHAEKEGVDRGGYDAPVPQHRGVSGGARGGARA